jgi:hypothetical protein
MSHALHMTPERLAEIQARIKSQCEVRTVRHAEKDEPAKRKPRDNFRRTRIMHVSESEVMRNCQRLLDEHPQVAFWWRVNTGAMKMDNGRFVKFSFVGASDLMAVSTKGRFIACECKATGKKPTEEQAAFLANVERAGGLGVCVDHPGKLALALRAL